MLSSTNAIRATLLAVPAHEATAISRRFQFAPARTKQARAPFGPRHGHFRRQDRAQVCHERDVPRRTNDQGSPHFTTPTPDLLQVKGPSGSAVRHPSWTEPAARTTASFGFAERQVSSSFRSMVRSVISRRRRVFPSTAVCLAVIAAVLFTSNFPRTRSLRSAHEMLRG